jgi:hypothetical protein
MYFVEGTTPRVIAERDVAALLTQEGIRLLSLSSSDVESAPPVQEGTDAISRISTGCGSWCVQLSVLPLNVPCCSACARRSVPVEPTLVSMRPRNLPSAAHFLLRGNESEMVWLPNAISLSPAARHDESPSWSFPSSVEARQLRHVVPLKARWQSPVLSTALHVFLPGCDPSLRAQIRRPESMELFPRAYRVPLFAKSFVQALIFLLTCDFGHGHAGN